MLDRDSIFGDFSDEAFSRGMCKLITKKTLSLLQYHKTRHEDFQKILNPYANQKILDDIKIKVFDDFSEKAIKRKSKDAVNAAMFLVKLKKADWYRSEKSHLKRQMK